jgi:hypothetical protein
MDIKALAEVFSETSKIMTAWLTLASARAKNKTEL